MCVATFLRSFKTHWLAHDVPCKLVCIDVLVLFSLAVLLGALFNTVFPRKRNCESVAPIDRDSIRERKEWEEKEKESKRHGKR